MRDTAKLPVSIVPSLVVKFTELRSLLNIQAPVTHLALRNKIGAADQSKAFSQALMEGQKEASSGPCSGLDLAGPVWG